MKYDIYMRYRLCSYQVIEASDGQKEYIRQWWTPSVGDWFMTRYRPSYFLFGGEPRRKYNEYLLTSVDRKGQDVWSTEVNFMLDDEPRDTETLEWQRRYSRMSVIRADALPLLSIGQEIALLNHLGVFWSGALAHGNKEDLCDTLWEIILKNIQ